MTISAYLVSSNTTLRPLYPALLVVPVKIVGVPLNLIVVLFLLHYGKHLAGLIFRELDVEGEVVLAVADSCFHGNVEIIGSVGTVPHPVKLLITSYMHACKGTH